MISIPIIPLIILAFVGLWFLMLIFGIFMEKEKNNYGGEPWYLFLLLPIIILTLFILNTLGSIDEYYKQGAKDLYSGKISIKEEAVAGKTKPNLIVELK